jgi:NADH:ubiquinone oxidoreductase subunit 2 (subunit N)
MRFLFIGSRFTLHASFPRSVALTQLRFTLLTVTSSQRDLHPQVCAHAGRTRKSPQLALRAFLFLVRLAGIEPTTPWFVAKYSIQLSYSRIME